MQELTKPRSVRLLAYAGANLLDISGPLQAFASASQYGMTLGMLLAPEYEVAVVSVAGGLVETSAGVMIASHRLEPSAIDTFLVAGGFGADEARADPATIKAIRAQSALARRTGSVCTGAFLLAQTGLLDGRRATTHWNWCAALEQEFPAVQVVRDAVFVEDGPVWTSAGVLAGVDLALAMIERDVGRNLANYTARALVAPQRRSGAQPQISAQLKAQESETQNIRLLMEWIAENPAADHSYTALAARACLSIRSLQRHFAREVGESPKAFVERTRVEHARRHLTLNDEPLPRVAARSGFRSVSAMQQAFARVLGISPGRYRREFSRPGRGSWRDSRQSWRQ